MCSQSGPLNRSVPAHKEEQEPERNVSDEQLTREHDHRTTQSSRTGRPYSLPQAPPLTNVSKLAMKQQFAHVSDDQIEPSNWYVEQAAPPLLLTFDAFDTLYTPKDPIHDQYCALATEYGFIFTPGQIKPAFKAAFILMSSKHPNYGKRSDMSPRRWWIQLMKETFRPLLAEHYPRQSLPIQFHRDLYNHFATKDGYDLYPDVVQLLSIIGLRSYQVTDWPPSRTMLGIISNSDPRVRSIIASFKQINPQDNDTRPISIKPALFPSRFAPASPRLAPTVRPAHFAFATISYEADVSKPDPAIYDRAMDDAQNALRRLSSYNRLTRSGAKLLGSISTDFHKMHVGDDLEKDVIPALKAGWDAILLDRTGEALISQRLVEVEEDRQMFGEQNGSKTTSFTIPVINSLLGLQHLVSRERVEKFHRDRMTRGIFTSSSMQRSMEDLSRSLAELEYDDDDPRDVRPEGATLHTPVPGDGESIGANESSEERKLPPEGYYEGELEKEIPDLFEEEDVPVSDSATSVDVEQNDVRKAAPEDSASQTDSNDGHGGTMNLGAEQRDLNEAGSRLGSTN
ncbi:MAG: hypothetical protein M1831_004764 [Alyxoria varia]|nr:MAG: hypothetical protein M1831_004764 [Alyxoria varia]